MAFDAGPTAGGRVRTTVGTDTGTAGCRSGHPHRELARDHLRPSCAHAEAGGSPGTESDPRSGESRDPALGVRARRGPARARTAAGRTGPPGTDTRRPES